MTDFYNMNISQQDINKFFCFFLFLFCYITGLFALLSLIVIKIIILIYLLYKRKYLNRYIEGAFHETHLCQRAII